MNFINRFTCLLAVVFCLGTSSSAVAETYSYTFSGWFMDNPDLYDDIGLHVNSTFEGRVVYEQEPGDVAINITGFWLKVNDEDMPGYGTVELSGSGTLDVVAGSFTGSFDDGVSGDLGDFFGLDIVMMNFNFGIGLSDPYPIFNGSYFKLRFSEDRMIRGQVTGGTLADFPTQYPANPFPPETYSYTFSGEFTEPTPPFSMFFEGSIVYETVPGVGVEDRNVANIDIKDISLKINGEVPDFINPEMWGWAAFLDGDSHDFMASFGGWSLGPFLDFTPLSLNINIDPDNPIPYFTIDGREAGHLKGNITGGTILNMFPPPTFICYGFEAPLGSVDISVKKNRALPVKVRLAVTGADFDYISAEYPKISLVVVEGAGLGSYLNADAFTYPSGFSDGDGHYSWNADEEVWQYNLKTKDLIPGNRYLVIAKSPDIDVYKIGHFRSTDGEFQSGCPEVHFGVR